MTAIAGDFFVDALPAADAYLLMDVLHDWADDECVAILAAIRRAARVDATVLVVESVLTGDRPDPRTGTLDVIMLAVTGGRERTPAELGALFERAEFVLQQVIPTAGPMRIIEARAAAAAGERASRTLSSLTARRDPPDTSHRSQRSTWGSHDGCS